MHLALELRLEVELLELELQFSNARDLADVVRKNQAVCVEFLQILREDHLLEDSDSLDEDATAAAAAKTNSQAVPVDWSSLARALGEALRLVNTILAASGTERQHHERQASSSWDYASASSSRTRDDKEQESDEEADNDRGESTLQRAALVGGTAVATALVGLGTYQAVRAQQQGYDLDVFSEAVEIAQFGDGVRVNGDYSRINAENTGRLVAEDAADVLHSLRHDGVSVDGSLAQTSHEVMRISREMELTLVKIAGALEALRAASRSRRAAHAARILLSPMASGMTPVAEALAAVLREATERCKGRIEERNTLDALGRALADDFRAPWNVPRHHTSIKDGYAVRAQDLQHQSDQDIRLEVIGSKAAGQDNPALVVGERQAVYVTTGSMIPNGADAVIEVEKTQLVNKEEGHEHSILVQAAAAAKACPNLDVRIPGSDTREGALLIEKGCLLGAAEVGILSMFGRATVHVIAAPRLGVLSTGDELIAPGASARQEDSSLIFDANRPMLLAKAQDAAYGKAEVVDLGILADQDNKEARDTWLQNMIQDNALDVLITSGGVSMGARDFVRGALERCGTVHVERIFMKPGKPLVFATVGDTLVFGLPGNPVSGTVTFDLLVAPALRTLAGWHDPLSSRLECRLAAPLRLDPIRPEYHRARLARDEETGTFLAHSTGFQRSSALPSMLGADVLLELPHAAHYGAPEIPAGTLVSAIIIGDLRTHTMLARPQAAAGPLLARALVSAGNGAAARLAEAARAAHVALDIVSMNSDEALMDRLRGSLHDEHLDEGLSLVLVPAAASFRALNEIDDALEKEGCRRASGISEVLRANAGPCQSEDTAWISQIGRILLRLDRVAPDSRIKAQLEAVTVALKAARDPALFQ
ncbi:Gephyrin [Hondaea fermentalgiana]|uniref:Gephyrin n=1 Tax=Hondaea fermentalgiana TaxID=2315210 RepID=A0A2R5GIB6_9STRA|nr:Gephyrin [Hondaea fermentalgiana]|eukprot:GBG30640.1 Gephyrin [Hondaea fermentalgiana]